MLKWVEVDANGDLDPQAMIDAIGPKTRLVAMSHMSNVLGTVFDVKPVIEAAACQGRAGADRRIARRRSTCRWTSTRWGADFLRDHGPQALWPLGGRARCISRPSAWPRLRPFMGGGDMIREVQSATR